MATIKVKLTGIPEKEPSVNENGNIDLFFKSVMSIGIPKGFQPLGDSYCIVRVASKAWERIADKYKTDSNLLIAGEAGINMNFDGMPCMEIIAFNIDIVESKDKNTTDKGEAKEDSIISNNGIMEIELTKIKVPDEFLNTSVNPLKLQAVIEYLNENGSFDKPIVINKKYNLLDGYKRYVVAKQLNMNTVPVIFSGTKVDNVAKVT